jgi:hypothetical protein
MADKANKSRKVIRLSSHLPYGGDPHVDRDGISTENHRQVFDRLVAAGLAGMHGRPGPRKPRKS